MHGIITVFFLWWKLSSFSTYGRELSTCNYATGFYLSTCDFRIGSQNPRDLIAIYEFSPKYNKYRNTVEAAPHPAIFAASYLSSTRSILYVDTIIRKIRSRFIE